MGSRTPVGASVVVALLSTLVLLTGCASNPHAVADHRARRDHYAVAPDTLSVEAFLALPESRRAARREMASDLRHSSEMLRYQQRRVEDMRWDRTW